MRKAILREDLMALTQDVTQALVLGQMLYWTKTLDKVNDWLFEENKRLAESALPQHEYNYGWIYKSAREMRDDLMNAFSEDAIQRAFTALVTKGVLMKRNNPFVRYDRKLQYRIDVVFLRRLLRDRGFEMTDFQLETIPQEAVFIPQGAESTPQGAVSIPRGAETITEITTEPKSKIELETTPLPPIGGTNSSAMASQSEFLELTQTIQDPISREPQHPASGKCATRATPKVPRKAKFADDAFLAELAKNNPGIDIISETRKMKNWLLANPSRQFTRAFAANWINRAKETNPTLPNGEVDWHNWKPNQ